MRVLVTRPQADAEATARVLEARGAEAVIAPLIEISNIPDASIDLGGVQAILVTSANGARALARATGERGVPVYAVGDASARVAAECGFTDVASANGDVADLAALVRRRLDPLGGSLVHVAGSAVAGNLGGELSSFQFIVRHTQLYRSQLVADLPDTARDALEQQSLDAVLFYSPRTAASFVRLVEAVSLSGRCGSINAVCLSNAVARELAAITFAEVRIAAVPTQSVLLDALF